MGCCNHAGARLDVDSDLAPAPGILAVGVKGAEAVATACLRDVPPAPTGGIIHDVSEAPSQASGIELLARAGLRENR